MLNSPSSSSPQQVDALRFDAELLASAMQGAVQTSLVSLATGLLCGAILWTAELQFWALAPVLAAVVGVGMRARLLGLYRDGRPRPERYQRDLPVFNLSVLASAGVFFLPCMAVLGSVEPQARILVFIVAVGGLAAGSLLVGFARGTFACWVGPNAVALALLAVFSPGLSPALLLPGLLIYILVLGHAARLARGNLATAFAERERANAATRTKSQFMANISHEIRTPMHGVLGNLEVLAQTQLDTRQAALLRAASGSGKALLSLIDEVLDFSKLETGLFRIRQETVVIQPMLDTVEQLFLPAARRKALAFSVVVDEGLPAAMESDALRLQQVLMNLVGNAIKFTDAGSVELRVACGASQAGPTIEFCVRDTGIGIAADDLARIFDPFEQAQAGAARRFGGTGLGLSISQQLVQALGGNLSVRSEPGQGSIFTVTLPLKARSAAAPGAVDSAGSATSAAPAAVNERQAEAASVPEADTQPEPLRVLVVDDNAVNRALAVAMLELAGSQVSQAVDGMQALDMLNAKPYDLVLMDWQMPGLDGLETTRRWRRQEALRASRRVMIAGVTANASAADEAACREAGMDAFLPKPFTLDGLKALVTQAAQR
ncbi:ATP-binding protein [Piscinibacterium candidicorallinum]|uniref:histidine kinase n=1 Tax=Piscinibacterium candidicorallinum TaxID=1793872 RepID=A0ABV7H8K8_9BURK